MADPLEKFRKAPIEPKQGADTTPPKEPSEYIAFDAKDNAQRLRIRRANAPTRSPAYTYLLDIAYDGTYGTNFVLVYTFMMVLVRGRNLQALITALELGTIDYIQEFDPDVWDKPANDNAAFIESIEVVVQESAPSISEAEKAANTHGKGRDLH
jgi:hypothetical protein